MKAQNFKTPIGYVHEDLMSRTLNMPINSTEPQGIDLLDNLKGVEVKSCLINPFSQDSKKHYVKWTLFDYQLTWHEKYKVPLYCALGSYQLDVPVSRIWTRNSRRLESHVTRRDFWIVPWSWTLGFPVRKAKHHDYRYLRPRPKNKSGIPPQPPTTYIVPLSKGLLHFTEGVDPSMFGF
jgi:hypothetical protein